MLKMHFQLVHHVHAFTNAKKCARTFDDKMIGETIFFVIRTSLSRQSSNLGPVEIDTGLGEIYDTQTRFDS